MAQTVAAKNKSIRQEALREWLSNKGLLDKVLDNTKKMEEQAKGMDPQELQGLKYATDTRLRLVSKYLPDLKCVEIGGSLNITNHEEWLDSLD